MKPMNTFQLSKDLSVKQIAAIVKRLSRKQKDKLWELIWIDMHDIPTEHIKVFDKGAPWTEFEQKIESR